MRLVFHINLTCAVVLSWRKIRFNLSDYCFQRNKAARFKFFRDTARPHSWMSVAFVSSLKFSPHAKVCRSSQVSSQWHGALSRLFFLLRFIEILVCEWNKSTIRNNASLFLLRFIWKIVVNQRFRRASVIFLCQLDAINETRDSHCVAPEISSNRRVWSNFTAVWFKFE